MGGGCVRGVARGVAHPSGHISCPTALRAGAWAPTAMLHNTRRLAKAAPAGERFARVREAMPNRPSRSAANTPPPFGWFWLGFGWLVGWLAGVLFMVVEVAGKSKDLT